MSSHETQEQPEAANAHGEEEGRSVVPEDGPSPIATVSQAPDESVPGAYDSPWKDGLELYLEPFLKFLFPEVHALVDWQQGYEDLATELRKIVPDAEVSEKRADKLFKVRTLEGKVRYLFIHIEVQASYDATFSLRMFVYNYRTFDRYKKPVISLAVLGDDDPDWCPSSYGWDHGGCRHQLEFPVAKLLRYNERWAELEEHAANNPFAVIVMAHLKTKATIRAPESRRQWKMTLVRALYRYGYGREDIQQLFRLIDWMMVLPESEARLFRDEHRRFESETEMPYVTSIERMSRSRRRRGVASRAPVGLSLPRASRLDVPAPERGEPGGAAALGRAGPRRQPP